MGVKGLWKLISNSGKPIVLEALDKKILAVDVSIWLYQAVHGMGASGVANAHLLTLFHRICKLLFYGIKPIFVFDGGVPYLKKQTLAARRLTREVARKKANTVRERLLTNLLKSQAVRKALGKKGPAPSVYRVLQPKNIEKDMFELPPLPADSELSEAMLKTDNDNEKTSNVFENLHDFDCDNDMFKNLPLQSKHEIMCELQSTRKENSWDVVNEMPQDSCSFAEYQMNRLLQRNKFQDNLDSLRSEIQKKHTKDLEDQLFLDLEEHVSFSQPIVSEEAAHSIIIKTKMKEGKLDTINKQLTSAFVSKIGKGKYIGKTDFLTELAKHGIVNQENMDELSDSDYSDDVNYIYKTKQKQEQVSFVKALNCVLDNEAEISQEEIYSLIQQSRHENVVEPMTNYDINAPSTSKQSDRWQLEESLTSSDDNADFIDVPEPDSDEIPRSSQDGDLTKSNIDTIRQTETTSLFLKIVQQRLEEIKPESNNKLSQLSIHSHSKGSVNISFEPEIIKSPIDDIFSDIFNTQYKDRHQGDVNEEYMSNVNSLSEINKHKTKNKELFQTVISDKNCEIDLNKMILSTTIGEDIVSVKNNSTFIQHVYNDISPAKNKINIEYSSSKDIEYSNSKLNIDKYVILDSNNDDQNKDKVVILDNNNDNQNINNLNSKKHDCPVKMDIDDIPSSQSIISNSNGQTVEENENVSLVVQGMGDSEKASYNLIEIENDSRLEQKLQYLESNLSTEQENLVSQVNKMERLACSISAQKFRDVQELLSLFGIPYIVAPMEAEAQCAFLNTAKLADGTITEDSDIFLFGGKQVYKNFFRQSEQVEVFDCEDIRRNYGLSQMKLIQFALLTGSDYTSGIESVGAVLAMELLAEFNSQTIDGLVQMKDCWKNLQTNFSGSSGIWQKLSGLHLPDSFPSKDIFKAYIQPEVDDSLEKFTWGIPDVEALTNFTANKFGWNMSKTGDILIPVLKKIDSRTTQKRIDSYFNKINLIKEPKVKSKRLLEAIRMSTGEPSTSENIKSTRKTIFIPDPVRPNENLKRKKQINTNKARKKKCDNGVEPNIVHETVLPIEVPLTKEEKKIRNFQNLLKRPKIPQVEKEKEEKISKRQKAIEMFTAKKKI